MEIWALWFFFSGPYGVDLALWKSTAQQWTRIWFQPICRWRFGQSSHPSQFQRQPLYQNLQHLKHKGFCFLGAPHGGPSPLKILNVARRSSILIEYGWGLKGGYANAFRKKSFSFLGAPHGGPKISGKYPPSRIHGSCSLHLLKVSYL